ncbi:protein SPA1-RELATED 2 [Ziziphus jujuba]|uniref:Protein SPA1-RELATED 2 n=1 Tax=Ziziphus jujuba TaxID=326968 RepID=A0ABM3I3J0_ZIZJJ|nr:protein SPA1-RELATED 2 [Ziziphus jujuba]XP_048319895.2 protein SPA1-RELATED 2 [Ziziphus jujuba]
MDDEVGEEVTPFNTAEGGHIQTKDGEYFLKSESCNMLEPHEMLIPGEGNYSQNPHQQFAEILDGKNINRFKSIVNAVENPYSGSHLTGDAGETVEELTVRNCDGSNLAIVGTSTNLGRIQPRQSQWQHLYQLASGSGSGSSHGDTAYRDNGQPMLTGMEDRGYSSFPDALAQKPDGQNESAEELTKAEHRGVLSSTHGGIRTKILSKSGFSEFFVKSTLKGKGIICKGPQGPQHDGHLLESGDQRSTKIGSGTVVASATSQSLDAKVVTPPSYGVKAAIRIGGSDCDGVTLREWLKIGHAKVNKFERLCIFKQIVDLVDYSYCQGIALYDLRPSYLKLLPSNQVKYLGRLGSTVQKEMLQCIMDQDVSQLENNLIRKRPVEQGFFPSVSSCAKKQKFLQSKRLFRQWPQFPTSYGFKLENANSINEFDEGHLSATQRAESKFGCLLGSNTREQMTSLSEQLEEKWYASPDELSEGSCTILSNIYSLGVLLFELLARFESDSTHATAMLDLRQRILPPDFLSENSKEAGFCLWLLHPEPSSRPTTREILQSEVVNGLQEVCAEELSSSVDQDDIESELLLHFLVTLKEQKQKDASKLVEDMRCLEADIEEVEGRHCSKKPLAHSSLHDDSLHVEKQNMFFHKEPSSSKYVFNTNESKLRNNNCQLESAYFSMRSKIQLPDTDATTRLDKELLRNRENWHSTLKDEEKQTSTDRLGAFFDGLCKYARYTKFEVRGVLRNGEFNSSSNVICSLSFDRDEDYFAAAGVSKKIKIFEFSALFNDSVDIHYPVIEMSNKSKLSCVSWNNYIKNYLASTDYDGAVKLWDASTGQPFSQYNEHEKRAWSVDFSVVCPTKLASGSDDCSVKLWSINEKNSLSTIRNIANVCCVQFSAHSTHLLAFGSADYRTYCYDLRYAKTPWCTLAGHDKAVSYVKFLDSETLVSASTDNTLKLWDLNKSTHSGLSTNACSLTLSGHTNEKNFVGLSVADGYVACGSETNEVYAYYRSLPMPITSHKFGSIDSFSGKETDDDNGQFVSSVCWRGKSDMLVAANSSGCIKVLQMV